MNRDVIKESFETTSEGLLAVVGYGETRGADFDRRLVMQAVPAGANSIVPSMGGFAVQDETIAAIAEKISAAGQMIPRVRKFPVSKPKTRVPLIDETSRQDGSRGGGLNMQWIDQGQDIPLSTPKFAATESNAKTLAGAIRFTGELLNDSELLGPWFEDSTAREAAFKIEDAIVNGSGVGQPLGILKSTAALEIAPASGQAAGTFTFANASAMAAQFYSASYGSPGAVWLMGNTTYQQALNEQTAVGAPLVTFDRGKRFMLGWEVLVNEYSPLVGQRGDCCLVDLGEYCLFERQPVGVVQSMHVFWLTDEGLMRAHIRADGHPLWNGPVTPKAGGPVQSPFIVLGQR
ncbi:MAG: phage major capsid protein [Burkholderiaceae bacterium]